MAIENLTSKDKEKVKKQCEENNRELYESLHIFREKIKSYADDFKDCGSFGEWQVKEIAITSILGIPIGLKYKTDFIWRNGHNHLNRPGCYTYFVRKGDLGQYNHITSELLMSNPHIMRIEADRVIKNFERKIKEKSS